MSINTLVLSVVCVVCGVVLAYLRPGDPTAAVLVGAGVTALGVSNINARAQVAKEKERANQERNRADEAMNATQQILLDKLPKK